jgi:hypothetical protein
MSRINSCKLLSIAVFLSVTQLTWAADALNFFNNWFVTGDYAVAGVGLRGTGVGGWATGKINMSGVPSTAQPIAAFLYWSTVETSTTPGAQVGYFNGNKIQGVVLGNPQSPNAPCWSPGSAPAGSAGFVYRADVLRYLPVDSNNNFQANGSQTVKLPDSTGGTVLYTDGASLVVIYKIVTPGFPDIAPLRAVVIYNGAYTMNKQSGAFTQNVAGFYQAAGFDNPRITAIAANGQRGFTSPVSVNGRTLDTDPFVGAQGPRWDNATYNIDLSPNASSFSVLGTAGTNQTCVTWAVLIASVNVQDSDHDGLVDLWESKGLHRNTQVSPATFGTCADYPNDTQAPCVNLPAMGANPNERDIFIQIDWMHGTGDGTGGLDGKGTHDHAPPLAALSTVAATFALHGIAMHYDVGSSYQGAQSACGNAPCSFIVPATYAQGGTDMDESSLTCNPGTQKPPHTCDYNVPYPVLSFEYGFASVKDGNQLLGISSHFAQNRKDIFHYMLFAHALGGPYGTNGQPVDPFTLQPTTTPKSYSGIAHRPGGGFMVTFGLWRSDIPAFDQVGSPQQVAGTIMHELGHNLGLGHAGLATKPNCMPNYPSVMNYMYQTRGLTDANGHEQVDYSYGFLFPLSENFLNTLIPMALPGVQHYRVRYYGPLAPHQPADQGAQVHCDGTPITGGVPEVRLEGAAVSTPDWSNGTVPLGRFITPLDLNYDGTIGQFFVDQPDWFTLNLQQIGTGYNFGGLSVGAFATDGGAYATDGGAFATDAGALATDGGVFATDGGAFATDGGAFATDGGAFATDGGAFATDGGAFATDAGELDETTVLLSSVDAPSQLTATNTATSIILNWTPPATGSKLTYNVYRCAGAGCTPAAPAFKTASGGTATPSFTDTVNDTTHGGTACPAADTCPNTTYVYAVTSIATVNSVSVESLFSNTATSEVTQLFVVADDNAAYSNDNTYTYDGTNHQAAFHVFGDVGGSLNLSSVTCTNQRNWNSSNYPVTCSGPTQTSPTNAVSYVSAGASYTDAAGMHTGGTLIINKRPITVTAAASSKTYDAITSSPATPTITLGSLGAGDKVTWTETYDTPPVGTTHTMIPAGTVTDTNAGNNYLVTFVNATNGVIITRPVTATLTAQNKPYDSTNAEPNTNMSCLLNNAVMGDAVACAATSGTFNSNQVSSANTVSATATLSGTAAANYTFGAAGTAVNFITPVTASANITTLPLTATLTSAPPKTYDGTTAETNTMTCSVTTVLSPDSLTCAATNGNFNTSQVATANQVTATATMSGSGVSNYTLGGGGTVASVTSAIVSAASTITTRAVTATLTAQNKPYNGTAAEPNMSCSLNGAVPADVTGSNVTCVPSNGTFNSTHVVGATTVNATATLGGSAATDYTFGAAGTALPSTGVMATPVSITPVPLSIVASSGSVPYGSPVPAIAAGYSGFVSGEGPATLMASPNTPPSCGTNYAQGSPVSGSPYPTTCIGAVDSDYTISYGQGSITVTQVALQITASSTTIPYGAPVPTITPSYSAFVNGETAATLSVSPNTAPVCSTVYTQGSAAGNYTTSCTGAVDGNYNISYVGGTVIVTPPATPLQITAGPVTGFQSYTYPATLLTATGGAPGYTWSWSGAPISGMNLTAAGVLTGYPAAAGTATVTVTDANSNSVSAQFTIVGPTSVLGSGDTSTTISNVSLNSGPVQITAIPGAAVTVNLTYNLVQGNTQGGDCPGCIDQLLVGFVNTTPTTCVYDGQPGPNGTGNQQAVPFNLTAPSTPGRYYIVFAKTENYVCQPSPPSNLGSAYTLGSADPAIAVVDVIPTSSVTWENITATNISVTPQVHVGDQVTATFTWSMPSSGTIGLGFNTDAALDQCGALNYGTVSPTFAAPSQPGRYYLSIDNPNTCAGTPPTPWSSGVPAANFARYIGAVDVLPPHL